MSSGVGLKVGDPYSSSVHPRMTLLSAICLLASSAFQGSGPRYHVLLPGVPEPGCPGFPKLGAVQSDLEALAFVLEQSWHVPKADVTIATDPKDTTKAGIKKLIQDKLIDPCKDKDDVVYFG